MKDGDLSSNFDNHQRYTRSYQVMTLGDFILKFDNHRDNIRPSYDLGDLHLKNVIIIDITLSHQVMTSGAVISPLRYT